MLFQGSDSSVTIVRLFKRFDMRKVFLLIFSFTIMSCTAKLFALIRLSPIMSGNMVLQQNSQTIIVGVTPFEPIAGRLIL